VGLRAAERQVGFFPRDPVAWRSLAARRLALGDLPGVDEALSRAERLGTDHPENRLLRAGWLERSGRDREALVEAERGLLLDPGNPELQLVAGRTALRLGQPERARPHLLAAAGSLPDRYEAQRLAGALLAADGDSAAAAPFLERARRLAP
jgi:tetratricopeptide (TPR) repeat protein